ncbi:hypothetical protein TCON_2463 [Astathelohania contejeani]|uniref:C2H2-type domain-containing protein n=1 Tax=Astathelohania contejeani TaxID=164912 RepID=A0ABQ7HVY0_9MICR|nr:hypothetical protein TCON_2463 [Thelohania contejeani]
MKRWFVENGVGHNMPFLERSLKNNLSVTHKQHITVNECSSMYILGLIPINDQLVTTPPKMIIYGYSYLNGHRINNISSTCTLTPTTKGYQVDDILTLRHVCFSCYEETVFYILLIFNKQVKYYYCEFSCCRLLRSEKVNMYEVKLFTPEVFLEIKKEPSFQLDIKIINLKCKKENSLHYNWVKFEEEEKKDIICTIIYNEEYILNSFMCIFCFRKYDNQKELIFHINNIHANYKAISLNGKIKINLEIKKEESEIFFYIKSEKKRYLNTSNKNTRKTLTRTYYEPEIFESLNTKFRKNDWLNYILNRKLEEIVDIPEEKVEFMKRWNAFIRSKSEPPSRKTIIKYVEEFVENEPTGKATFDFLTLLYKKCILSITEIKNIIKCRMKINS